MDINIDLLISGIVRHIDKSAPLFGGLSGANFDPTSPVVFGNAGVFQKGVGIVGFDLNQIEVEGIVTSGWRSIGTPKTVTESRDNVVFSIEGIKASEVMLKYLRLSGNKERPYAMEYPIEVTREDGSRIIRSVFSLDEETGAAYYAGNIPEGSKIKFCSPDIENTIQNTLSAIDRFRERYLSQKPDAVLLFSCNIRKVSFGEAIKTEIQAIRDTLMAPVAGFFSYGEIGRDDYGNCEMHSTTLAIVALRMKGSIDTKAFVNTSPSIGKRKKRETVTSLNESLTQLRNEKLVLSNFLHRTSEDLDQALSNLESERAKSERLLLNILPESIANRLKSGNETIADYYNSVSVLFADIVGFTKLSAVTPASEILGILNTIFSRFDALSQQYGVEKIKTIGDAYMAASGIPIPAKNHAQRICYLALDMLQALSDLRSELPTGLSVRIGIHSGSAVAGVIGTNKFAFDLWGDTVNTASRMESHGQPGKIQISESTYSLIAQQFITEKRGEIEVKGKGEMLTYFLIGKVK